MKNLTNIILLVFAFTLVTQAQVKKKRANFSVEQQTDLAVKKMTLALDLSEKQQNEIRPLLNEQIAERKAFREERKAARKENKKPTADEIYAMKNKMLDSKIAMKNKMKTILNKEQLEKFEKMARHRNFKEKKRVKSKKMTKKLKNIEENN
jgi:hypothetical protein